jgi:O-antigen/teichoic acid export membrane protein
MMNDLRTVYRTLRSRAGANAAANMIGRGTHALILVLTIPLYIHYIGVEAWGLVGFHITSQVILSFFELGLPATISREISQCATRGDWAFASGVIRTAERYCIVVACIISLLAYFASGWICRSWLDCSGVPESEAIASVRLMGLAVGMQLINTVYFSGLNGLGRMLATNTILVSTSLLRAVVTLLSLHYLLPSVTVYFVGFLATSCFSMVLSREWLLTKTKARSTTPTAQRVVWARIWKFAGTVTMNNLAQSLLLQFDKIALSGLLTLSAFAVYSISYNLAYPVYIIGGTITTAMYPELCALSRDAESVRFSRSYQSFVVLLGWVVWPLAVVLAVFSREILCLWTGDASVAESGRGVLALLSLASAFSIVNLATGQMLLALGKVGRVLAGTLFSLVVVVLGTVIMGKLYGAVGAACVQIASGSLYLLLVAPLLTRKTLPLGYFRLMVVSGVVPFVLAMGVALLVRQWGLVEFVVYRIRGL